MEPTATQTKHMTEDQCRRSRRRYQELLAGAVISAVLHLSGCMNLQLRAGTRPIIAALEQSLTIGKSTADDVIAAVGPPTGKGMSMFPFDQTKRPMWSYYYEESSLEDGRRTFLYVYFKDNRYDGYLWFSSLSP